MTNKRRETDYRIVMASDEVDLTERVNMYLARGYVTCGNLINHHSENWIQPVIMTYSECEKANRLCPLCGSDDKFDGSNCFACNNGENVYWTKKGPKMKLFEVTNGQTGYSYTRCLVCAVSTLRAIEMAKPKFEEEANKWDYKSDYYENLKAEELCTDLDSEWVGNITSA